MVGRCGCSVLVSCRGGCGLFIYIYNNNAVCHLKCTYFTWEGDRFLYSDVRLAV